ncbi:MAG: MmcQ/YjbR family DNA-binding protein [bacterium]|nr:MmcQ/YjbR family DNA-binding protein [Myxococcales bacterium]MCB9551388.1 MmcQ/YjbR family DNA-binding protein [Myxococcales bacterium]
MSEHEEITSAAEAIRAFALGLPETNEEFPWGETVFKVRKKVFVFMGLQDEQLGFSVKLPASGEDVLCMPFASPTGYGLGKAGWVSFRFGRGELPPHEELIAWVEESFRAVAPKTVVKKLDAARGSVG